MASVFIGPSPKLMGTLFTMLISVVLFATSNAAAAPNNFDPGWCTWGAAELFNATAPEPGANWHGNADQWLWNAAAAGWEARTSPFSVQVGAIICWTGGAEGWGHVAYVRDINWVTSEIEVQEMNWAAFGQWDTRWLPMANLDRQGRTATYVFAGYINPNWGPSCNIPRP